MRRRFRAGASEASAPEPSTVLALACVAAFALACGDAPPATAFSVQDSAGVRIVTNHRPSDVGVPRIGPLLFSVGDEETMPFASVRDALILSDGRLAVLDSHRRMVFLFDGRGHLLDSLGAGGDGPGEFRRPLRLGSTAASDVRVYDQLAQSLTTFPGGDDDLPPRTSSLTRERLAGDLMFVTDSLAVVTRGSFQEQIDDRAGRPGRMPVQGEVSLLGITSRDEVSFATATLRESIILSGSMISSSPFSHRLAVAAAADHVVLGSTDGFRLRRYDLDGRLFQEIRHPALVRPVDPQEVDSLRERHRRLATAEGGIVLEGIFEPDAQPELRPSFGRMVVSPSGWIWIGDFVTNRRPPGEWIAFDPQGRLAGRVEVPEGLEPIRLGESRVILRRVDSLGVESVEVRALVLPRPASDS